MIVGLIPARSGSKGVPGKNIKLLAGYPLLAYSIAAAKLVSRIDRIVVSTDSEQIAAISQRFGAETPFLRPAELAADHSLDRDFVLHALAWFETNEGKTPDYLVHLRPTTPLREPKLIEAGLETFLTHPEATSLRSGHPAPESPFKWFTRDPAGYFHGLSPEAQRPGAANLPRQAFPEVYVPNGYVDVLRTSFVLNSPDLHGPYLLGYISPVCQEVDTLEDFERLEFTIQKRGSPLLELLRENYPSQENL
jgi:N-acylneuraminate cytidylyltransferase